MSLTNSAVRVFLQVRTTRDASSTLGAAPVCGYPFAALCHVLHLTVTACKCPGQAVCTEAEANMKNPSKAVLLQCQRRLLLVSYAAKTLFFPVSGNPVRAPWQSLCSLNKNREGGQ